MRDFFFGLLLLHYAPRGCSFQPVLTKSGYVHRSEDVCYRVQLILLFWTNRQNIRTPEQFSSTARDIYYSVRNANTTTEGSNYGKARRKGCSHHGWIERLGASKRQALCRRGCLRFHHG